MLRDRRVVNEMRLTKLYVIKNKKRRELNVLRRLTRTRDDGYPQCVNETRRAVMRARVCRGVRGLTECKRA